MPARGVQRCQLANHRRRDLQRPLEVLGFAKGPGPSRPAVVSVGRRAWASISAPRMRPPSQLVLASALSLALVAFSGSPAAAQLTEEQPPGVRVVYIAGT